MVYRSGTLTDDWDGSVYLTEASTLLSQKHDPIFFNFFVSYSESYIISSGMRMPLSTYPLARHSVVTRTTRHDGLDDSGH